MFNDLILACELRPAAIRIVGNAPLLTTCENFLAILRMFDKFHYTCKDRAVSMMLKWWTSIEKYEIYYKISIIELLYHFLYYIIQYNGSLYSFICYYQNREETSTSNISSFLHVRI